VYNLVTKKKECKMNPKYIFIIVICLSMLAFVFTQKGIFLLLGLMGFFCLGLVSYKESKNQNVKRLTDVSKTI